jgi:hypothetical protein
VGLHIAPYVKTAAKGMPECPARSVHLPHLFGRPVGRAGKDLASVARVLHRFVAVECRRYARISSAPACVAMHTT